MSEDTRTVYVGGKTHGKLKGLVGRKAEAGFKTSIRDEVEASVEAHIHREMKKLKKSA